MAGSARAPRFSSSEKQILLFTGCAHALTHFVELTYPTLAVVLAAEAGLPLEQVLGWSLGGYLLFGLGALPAGLAADRLGSKRVVILGLLVAGLSTLAAALAAPGWPLALCLAGMGLGASAYHPAGMGLLSRAVSARGTALGINGIYGNVGIALAPVTTAALATRLGWRGTLALSGAVLIATAALGAAMRFREPPTVPPEELGGRERSVAAGAVVTFSVLCGVALLAGFAYRGNTLALPALFSERLTGLNFGVATTLAMLAGIGGQYIGGRVADRADLAWGYLAFHALSLPMLLVMTFATDLPLLLGASLYVFFALGMQPVENTLFADLTPERWRSTAYGLKFTLTFGVGASAVVMVRWVAASQGFVGVYQVLSVVVAALTLLAFVLVLLRRSRTSFPRTAQG